MALEPVYRVVTLLPPDAVEDVVENVVSIANLSVGHYNRVVWWSAPGTEQFQPLPGAEPRVGRIGEVHRVPSVRLEFSIPRDEAMLTLVVDEGIRAAHPYEEPVVLVFDAFADISSSE